MRTVTLAMVTALWACGESNEAPRVIGAIADQDLFVGVSVLIGLDSIFEDPEGDRLLYAATSSAAEMTELTGAALRVTGTDKGTATVTVSATDPEGASAETSFNVTVANRPPEAVGSIADQEMHRNESVSIDLDSIFDDPDGDALEYEATATTGLAMTEVAGSVLTVSVVELGTDQVAVSASDPEGEMAHVSFEVTVSNRDPEAARTIGSQDMIVGRPKNVGDMKYYFRDPDGDELAFAVLSSDTSILHAFMADDDTLKLVGAALGQVTVMVTATDGIGEASQAFAASVNPWRDDFDRNEIGGNWQLQQEDGNASIVDGWLRTELDGVQYWLKSSPVKLVNGWTIATSFKTDEEDSGACTTVKATFDHDRFNLWDLLIDWNSDKYQIYMDDDEFGSFYIWGDEFKGDPGAVVEMNWWLEGDSMHMSFDGDTVASFDPTEESRLWPDDELLPMSLDGVGLGVFECWDATGVAEFDWVEIRVKK